MNLPAPLRPFGYAQYRLLCAGLMLSLFADGIYTVGVVWQVIGLGGGAGQLSLVTTVYAAGMVASTLLGGVLADRISQRVILIVLEVLRFVGCGIAGVLGMTGYLHVWHMTVVGLILGVAEGIYYPAYSSILPSVIPSRDLLAANGVEGTARPVVFQGVGPAVGGGMIAVASPGLALLASGIASGCAAAVYLSMKPVSLTRDLSGETRNPVVEAFSDIGEGFAYMWRTPWLMATLLFACVLVLMTTGPLEVLVPFAIKDQAGGDAGDHSLVLAAYGVGAAVGSIATVVLPLPRRYMAVLMGVWSIAGTPFLIMGMAHTVWLFALAGFVLGLLFDAPMVIWGTLLQSRVPREMLGRISGLDGFVSVALMPVSMALAGPVSHALGLTTTMMLVAVIPIPFGVVAYLWARLYRDEISHPLRADVSDDDWVSVPERAIPDPPARSGRPR